MNEAREPSTPRTLGSLGQVGPLSFGCWRLTGSDSANSRVISAAIDTGMNLVDNADVYGLDWGGTHFGACEEALGRVLAAMPGLRNKIVLATKGGIIPGVPYDSSSQYLIKACEASLSRLGVDHVDLYQIHRPDHYAHPQEIATAFESLLLPRFGTRIRCLQLHPFTNISAEQFHGTGFGVSSATILSQSS